MIVRDGLVGYIRRDGKVLSPPTFLAASHFHQGVAWVEVPDKKFCLINLAMEPLIEGIEESPRHFKEGLAPVKIEGKFGYIDRRGTMVIRPRYDSASPFSEGLALVTSRRGTTANRLAGPSDRRPRFRPGSISVLARTGRGAPSHYRHARIY